MKFYMPVRVYDEKDCVRSHGKELSSFGAHALIVTGRHSAKACGALDDVISVLAENGKTYSIFSEIEENPSVETVLKAAAFGKEEKADFVIGIGGGSPLDAAKAIAFLMYRENGSAADLYDASLPADSLPVIAVPTTCGTGSEVTGVSVLTVHEKKTKQSIPHRIFPKLALVDGKYLCSAPHAMIVNTAVDAFAHMAESYLSVKADDYSKAAALGNPDAMGNLGVMCAAGYGVEKDEERILVLFPGLAEQVFYLRVGIGCQIGDHALMIFRGHFIQTASVGFRNLYAGFLSGIQYRGHGSRSGSLQYIELFYASAGPDGLKNGISSKDI